jgi:Mg2+ and Co2+ transporter CorA
MTNIAQLSQIENKLMVQLAKKATRDNHIVKTLTLLAIVFLPASFVSVSAL